MKNVLLLGTLALAGAASAAPKISAQSIIVNPVQADLNVKVWTNKDPSGSGTPDYRVGERVTLYTSVSKDAYVYLFNVNPDGSIDQILPNRYTSGANFLKTDTVKQFPAPGDNFTFDIAGPAGLNKVLAVASQTPLNLDQISQFKSDQGGFATVNVRGQQNLAQALSIVVNPIPQNSWTTDVAFYNTVTAQAPAPRTGSITLNSNADGANVYLNDRLVGQSGGTFTGLPAGNYRVRVSAPGYGDYTTTLALRAGASLNLSVTLQEQRVNLTVRSNVEGAQVFVNGRESGTIRGGSATLNLQRDNYQIVVIAPGYRANLTTVQVRSGGTLTLNLNRAP